MQPLEILKILFYIFITGFALYNRIVVHRKELKSSGKVSVVNVLITVVLLTLCYLFCIREIL
jgi:hypothetical protein